MKIAFEALASNPISRILAEITGIGPKIAITMALAIIA